MPKLTARQAEIVMFIRVFMSERGYAPTLREIGDYFGIRSTQGVIDHLKALERRGVLTRDQRKSRSIVFINQQEFHGKHADPRQLGKK